MQYFGSGDRGGAEGGDNADGHWVVVTGYTRDTIRYHCPIDGPGEIEPAQFLANWYDRDQAGKPYVRFALSVGAAPANS